MPMGPAASYWDEKRRRVDDHERQIKALMAWMKRAFERRAAWSKRQLEDRDVCSTYLLKDTLVVTAYYLVDGPLKDQWVRWGYDPAQDAQSRLLQSVQVRMSSSYWRVLNTRIWGRLGSVQRGGQCINLDSLSWAPMAAAAEGDKELQAIPLVLFETRIKGSFAFQLCNLHAEPLLEMVAQARVLPQWDKNTGWYSETALDLFSVRVLQYLEQQVDAFIDKHTRLGTLMRQPPAPSAARKEYEEQPGFSHQLWEWQERFEQLPVLAAGTQEEVEEGDQITGCLVHPGYRGFKKLGMWTDSVLKKIFTKAARASAKSGGARGAGGAARASSSAAPAVPVVDDVPCAVPSVEPLDYNTISASQPFDTFNHSDSSEGGGDSDSDYGGA